MPGFVTRNAIARPPEVVSDFVTDLSRWSTFRGSWPIPGIVRAETVDGAPVAIGSRIRVTNTDGSVHHEVFVVLDRGRQVAIRMELARPASLVLGAIEERLDLTATGEGTEVVRRFELRPRSVLLWPFAWVLARFLRRAVVAHDALLAAALRDDRVRSPSCA